MKLHAVSALLAFVLLASHARAQLLLAVESTNRRVMLLSADDGSLVNPSFIDLNVAGSVTPIEALVVGNEIWVSDQVADKLMRFSIDGTAYLGDVTGPIDNIRGIELVGNEVWVTNSGDLNGAPGDSIARFSSGGVHVGSFPVGDPFDVVNYAGHVLVADIGGDDLERHGLAGEFLGTFHDSNGSTGIEFPEQLWPRANGNVLAAGFLFPDGVYEYDPNGAQIGFWPVGTGSRGVAELGNGTILFTDSDGIHVLDPATGSSMTVVPDVGGRFVTRFGAPGWGFTTYCPGDGSGAACPCGNASAPGANTGCLSSLLVGGSLRVTGQASISADTVVLSGTQMPNSSALYFQGTSRQSGGAGIAFGDGLRCAGGAILRIGTRSNQGGASQYPGPGNPRLSVKGLVTVPGTRTYQIWYRNAATFCTANTFNLSNGVEILWGT